MDVLKNVLLNWVLPVVAAMAIYALIVASRAPQVELDPSGHAPLFTLAGTDGTQLALESLRGRTVVLNFWGTWCGPCKAEIPELNRFAREHPEVAVVGVAIDSGTLPVLADASRKLGIEYPVVRGNGGVQSQYGVRSVPTTFIVDAAGVITRSHVGTVSAGSLARWTR